MNDKAMNGFDPRNMYQANPLPNFGEAELFIGGKTNQVISRICIFLFFVFRPEYQRSNFKGVTIIAPPLSAIPNFQSQILKEILEAIDFMTENKYPQEKKENIIELIKVIPCSGFDSNNITEILLESDHDQLVLIPFSSKYKNSEIIEKDTGKRLMSKANEDCWVPHLTSLTTNCLTIAKEKNSLLVFEAPEFSPMREVNKTSLYDVEDLYPVYILETPESQDSLSEYNDNLLGNIEKWSVLVQTGKLPQALSELNSEKIADSIKDQLTIQLIARSGDTVGASKLIKNRLDEGIRFAPETAAFFAKIAFDARKEDLVIDLYSDSIDEILNQDMLEMTLSICLALSEQSLWKKVYKRIESLFPSSESLRHNCQQRLFQICQDSNHKRSIDMYGFTEVEKLLANSLCCDSTLNHDSIISQVSTFSSQETDLAVYCYSLRSFVNEDYIVSLELAMSINELSDQERYSVYLILNSIEKMLLLKKIPQNNAEYYKLPLHYVLRFLARNPLDSEVRTRLVSILSVESFGSIGLPLIVSFSLNIASEGVLIKKDKSEKAVNKIDENYNEISNSLEGISKWISTLPHFLLGETQLPKELIPKDVELEITQLREVLTYSCKKIDLTTSELLTYTICLLAPHCYEESNEDISALMSLASQYSVQGQHQKSRDLAEQILDSAEGTIERKRIAWRCFSDIYQRTSDPINALVGIACSFLCNTKIHKMDIFHEMLVMARILRELHLHKLSGDTLTNCLKLCEKYNLGIKAVLRVKTTEFGLRYLSLINGKEQNIHTYIEDLTEHCNEVINAHDEILPCVTLLLQAISLYESNGKKIDHNTADTLAKALNKTSPTLKGYIKTVADSKPDMQDVLKIYNSIEMASFSNDSPKDTRVAIILARRFLQKINAETDPKDIVLALELLSEKGIDTNCKAYELDKIWPFEFSQKLTSEDCSIVMLGMDEQGYLKMAIIEGQNITIPDFEDNQINIREFVNRWSKKYPYSYGFIEPEDGNNEFYLTLDELNIPLPASSNILVVAEPLLQQIPINLVLKDEGFIGNKQAIGYVPSLTWLKSMSQKPLNKNNRRMAWISVSEEEGAAGTLEVLHGRLEGVFQQYGFEINTRQVLPTNFINSSMAVVTAHGGLSDDKRYIHKISDEGVLAESPKMLARSLAGVELVILFVCSGGRVDQHPYSNTTVGLPKLLLDNGCRTVIASPWPLSAVVVGPWLEEFMKNWNSGVCASIATFNANKYVESRLGMVAQYSLAMTVYGDLLLQNS